VSSLEAILITILEPILNPVWVALITGEKPGVLTVIAVCLVVRHRDPARHLPGTAEAFERGGKTRLFRQKLWYCEKQENLDSWRIIIETANNPFQHEPKNPDATLFGTIFVSLAV